MRFLIFFLILCILSPSVNAMNPALMGGVIAVTVASNSESGAQDQAAAGCMPPVDYALQNDCELELNGRWAVNTYTCGCKVLTGDCKGNVVKSEEYDCIKPGDGWKLLGILGASLSCGILIVVISRWVMNRRFKRVIRKW